MKMNHMWFFVSQNFPEFARPVPSPNRAKAKGDFVPDIIFVNFVIAADVFKHLVSSGAKQLSLTSKHFIFTPAPLIVIVHKQAPHRPPSVTIKPKREFLLGSAGTADKCGRTDSENCSNVR
jgi:hypothetical protein